MEARLMVFLLSAFVLVASGAVAAAPPGLVFHVGGTRGWRVPDADTSYGWWAMNSRFHVGDALYFKYESDSVLVVDREDFNACNATEPLARFADGSTTVRLDRPGFFCFISGEPGHCEEGQRLIVRVMVHPASEVAAAPGPAAFPPATSQLPGHGGGGSGGLPGNHPGWPGTSSEATAGVAASLALMAMMAVLLVVILQ